MKNFIFDIIKRKKEERDRKDKRIPLYKELPDQDRIFDNNPPKEKDKYVEIDFDIDQFDINSEMKL